MTQAKSELEELQELHKESEMLREKQEALSVEPAMEAEVDIAAAPASPAELVAELTGPVENILSELEEAATEHPALALLAAFGIGIFVGQLLARR